MQAEAKYGPVSAWDVSEVTNMKYLFFGCAAFDQPLGEWKVDQVTNMGGMFYGAAAMARKPPWYSADDAGAGWLTALPQPQSGQGS